MWKWGCINDVNPWKISSGCGGRRKAKGGCGEKRNTDRTIAWWTERPPQGLTFSLHEFPHVSISHLLSASRGSHLLSTPSPVSMTGSNNRLENIYLAKVAKSHVVVRCENARGFWGGVGGGSEDAVMFFWEVKMIRLHSQTEDELQNGIQHVKKKRKTVLCPFKERWCTKSSLQPRSNSFWWLHLLFSDDTCRALALSPALLFYTDSSSPLWIPAYLRLSWVFFCDSWKCLMWCIDLLN